MHVIRFLVQETNLQLSEELPTSFISSQSKCSFSYSRDLWFVNKCNDRADLIVPNDFIKVFFKSLTQEDENAVTTTKIYIAPVRIIRGSVLWQTAQLTSV